MPVVHVLFLPFYIYFLVNHNKQNAPLRLKRLHLKYYSTDVGSSNASKPAFAVTLQS